MSDTNTSELLIKIKTILESQGVDQAKVELNKLITTQSDNSANLAQNTKEQEKNRLEMEKAARAAFVMRQATNGSTESMRGMLGLVAQLGGSFGALAAKAGLIGTAFGAGFTVGKLIREKIWGPIDECKQALADFQGAAETLNKMKLDTFNKQITDLANQYERAQRNAERLNRLAQARDDAQLGSELAANQNDFESGKITEGERNQRDWRAKKDSAERKLDNEQTVLESNRSQAVTQVNDAHSRRANLMQASGSADTELSYALGELKRAGGDEASISGDDRNKVIGDLMERLRKAQKQKAFAYNWTVNTETQQNADRELKQVEAEIQWAPKILAARGKKRAAADAIATSDEKDKRIEADKLAEIADIDANLELIPKKRASMRAQFDTEQTKLQAAENAPTPESEAAIDMAARRRAYRTAVEMVQPLTVESDGSVSGRGGRETQKRGITALYESARQINAGIPDAEVWANLEKTMLAIGTKTSEGYAKMKFLIDQLDGISGTIDSHGKEIGNINGRQKVARGND